jgi:broad specificity phosphatase PhoE
MSLGFARIVLLRHGQSTFNAVWEATGADPGERDAPLTALGVEQVRQMAARVAELSPELVVTSPATRALQTTMLLLESAAWRPRLIVEALVRDRFAGDSCDYGRAPTDLAGAFPAFDFSGLTETWWHPSEDVPGAAIESREAFAARVAKLSAWLTQRPERTVLVVGHEGTFRYLAGVRLANAELMEWDRSAVMP